MLLRLGSSCRLIDCLEPNLGMFSKWSQSCLLFRGENSLNRLWGRSSRCRFWKHSPVATPVNNDRPNPATLKMADRCESALAGTPEGKKLSQVEWQKKIEELYQKADVADFLKLVDFDKLTANLELADTGARSLTVKFPQVEGVTDKLAWGRQIFALKKGRSVVPHGHNNMATAFLILKGDFRGRHYDRIARRRRAHDHHAHNRPQVLGRGMFDRFGLQGQRALVPGALEGPCVHFQYSCDGDQFRHHRADGTDLYRSQWREAQRRADLAPACRVDYDEVDKLYG